MSEKVYYLEEVRDKYAQIRQKSLSNTKDDIIYYMISHLIRSGMPKEDIYPLLQEISILCDPLCITQETKEKINKAIEICPETKREISLAQEVNDFIKSRHGVVMYSSQIDKELNISSKIDKKNRSKILERMLKNGEIERYGNRTGCFRIPDKRLDIIDRKKDFGQEIDLVLPLSLNELARVYPKNIIVIAGMSNAGKTAFLLNTVGLNIDKHKGNIIYFSSEMGRAELNDRLGNFGLPDEVWDGCIFVQRSSNFQDVILPNGINIIDYFEICENFSKIADSFKFIADKLDNGIAVIALQKTGNKQYGRGGDFSTEKPRLYLTLDDLGDSVEVIIVKAKNWKTKKYNPNGLRKLFKIEGGYKLIELTNWHREQKNGH